MNITHLGHSCFKLEEKVENNAVSVVTDPYDKSCGLRLPKTRADIVTVSHDHEDHNNSTDILPVNEKVMVFDRPGEYESAGVFLTGIGSYHDKQEGEERGKSNMFKIDMGGMKVLHLGDLGTKLSDAQLGAIGDIDILLIPVGGKYTIDAKEAAEVVRQLEPRIVIPMHYKVKGLKYDIEGVDKFIKQVGLKAEKIAKLKVAKKDLPQEETQLVVFE